MTDQMREPGRLGRRADDGVVRINLKRIAIWVGFIVTVATGSNTIFGCLSGKLVTPAALKTVSDSVGRLSQQQGVTTVALTRVNLRLDSVSAALAQFADVAEIMAIDICLRRRNDPYALRKLNCQRYLDGQP